MSTSKTKKTKCPNPSCICRECVHRRNTSLTKCKNGNCRYCERDYPNDTKECPNFQAAIGELNTEKRPISCSQDGAFENQTIPFSMVSNYALHDSNLSFKAKGLYAVIQSFITIPGYTLYKSKLLEQATDGLRSFNSGWEELKEAGYLKQKRQRIEKGFKYTYVLLWEPDLDTPATVNVRMDGTIVDNEYSKDQTTFDELETEKTYNKKNSCLDIEVEDEYVDTEENDIEAITTKVKKQINYYRYKSENDPHIDNILNLLVEILTTKNATIRAGTEEIPTIELQNQCNQLDSVCIEDILTSLKKYKKPIKNPRAFLITALYNAPKTAYTRKYSEESIIPDG